MRETIPKDVEKELKEIIFRFVNPLEYKVFIFGSRSTGRAKKYSDFDIGIIGKKSVPWRILSLIEEAFEESDLPYKVDIVDFFLASQGFREVALSKIKKL